MESPARTSALARGWMEARAGSQTQCCVTWRGECAAPGRAKPAPHNPGRYLMCQSEEHSRMLPFIPAPRAMCKGLPFRAQALLFPSSCEAQSESRAGIPPAWKLPRGLAALWNILLPQQSRRGAGIPPQPSQDLLNSALPSRDRRMENFPGDAKSTESLQHIILI